MHSRALGNLAVRVGALLAVGSALGACDLTTAPTRDILVLEIAPQKVSCTGVAPQECLQVREPGGVEWTYFYDPIEGFTFEPGFLYVVRVERTEIRNPPQDGSSVRWRLLAVLSKTAAP